jgi:hypothetical protein
MVITTVSMGADPQQATPNHTLPRLEPASPHPARVIRAIRCHQVKAARSGDPTGAIINSTEHHPAGADAGLLPAAADYGARRTG